MLQARRNGRDIGQLAAEVMERCDALARCSDEAGRVTRLFCSPAMRDAHRLMSEWMKAAGMSTRVDGAANLIGTFLPAGCNPRRRVIIGSHLDSVVDAGRYDGVLGVLMGVAAVQSIAAAGRPLPWAIEVVAFSDEEGVRFGMPFIGSLGFTGRWDEAMLQRTDDAGATMREALAEFGVDPSTIADSALAAGDVVAYIEPHIEQGPLLEVVGEPLGVVTAIAGQSRLSFRWIGEGGHAGTVPMPQRSNPLVAAARWISEVDRVGCTAKGLVATVGRVEVSPNISNCIPREVRLSLDVRHAEDSVRAAAVRQLRELAQEMAAQTRLALEVHSVHEQRAVAMDRDLTERLAAAAEAAGFQPQRMVSGAGHDAGVMAAAARSAMLFLRCPGGVSHHPDEAVAEADVAAGLQVLCDFVASLV